MQLVACCCFCLRQADQRHAFACKTSPVPSNRMHLTDLIRRCKQYNQKPNSLEVFHCILFMVITEFIRDCFLQINFMAIGYLSILLRKYKQSFQEYKLIRKAAPVFTPQQCYGLRRSHELLIMHFGPAQRHHDLRGSQILKRIHQV